MISLLFLFDGCWPLVMMIMWTVGVLVLHLFVHLLFAVLQSFGGDQWPSIGDDLSILNHNLPLNSRLNLLRSVVDDSLCGDQF